MAKVPDIIDDLGGATAIASRIGVPLTTVHSWKRAHFVPSWRIPALIDLAATMGKPLTEADFPTERPGAARAAA